MRRLPFFALSLATAVGLGAPAAALPVLLGIDSASDGLTVVDPATGVVTVVGPLGPPGQFPVPVSLARDPATGLLYTWNNQSGLNGLVVVDPATGAGTHVNPAGPSPARNFGAISFAADGNLYAVSGAGTWTIDLVTGIPTMVDENFLPDMSGADLSPAGALFMTTSSGYLYRNLDPMTGIPSNIVQMVLDTGGALDTIVQTIAFAPGGALIGSGYRRDQFEDVLYTYDVPTDRILLTSGEPPGRFGSAVDFEGITFLFDPSGTILGAEQDGVPVEATPSTLGPLLERYLVEPARDILFDIDSTTGVVSNLRDVLGPAPQGLVFIPEPAGAALLAIGLAALGAARRRRASAPRRLARL